MDPRQIPHAGECPDENTLAAYVDGHLPDADKARVLAHLDSCDGCHHLAAGLARAFLHDDALAHAATSLVRPRDADTEALSRLQARRRARLPPGSKVGKYLLGRAIGEGGMGVVYVASDPELAREVALKVVGRTASDSPALGKRLVREARSAAQLQHPNIVTIFDVGQVDGSTYLAMELIAGRSLRAYVGDRSVPLRQRVAWLVDVARALAAAHRRGLVHRDIKPENVMVRDDGVIKVVDFGIALRTEARPGEVWSAPLTGTDAIVGTPLYMAPEQLRNEELDGRCDQFAWGVLAYELVSGARPWKAEGLALVGEILTADAPRLTSTLEEGAVPPALAASIGRAMAKAPADRFPSMDDAAAALLAATALAPPRAAPDAPRRRMLAGAVALALGAAVALAGAGLLAPHAPSATEPAPAMPTAASPLPPPPAAPQAPWTAAPAPSVTASAPPVSPSALDVPAARRAPIATPGRTGPTKAIASSSASAPSATTTPSPAAGCDPPYTWRAGVKVPKPECPLD